MVCMNQVLDYLQWIRLRCFDVNKITILKAMDVLKSEGVIYSIPAKGTFVTEVLKQDVSNKKSISSSKKTLSIVF